MNARWKSFFLNTSVLEHRATSVPRRLPSPPPSAHLFTTLSTT